MKIPVGDSERRETGEGITQGSSEAGIVSSTNLSKGVDYFFVSSEEEISYGPLKLLPQSFQDDLCRLCLNPLSAQMGLDRLQNLADTKLLEFNHKKTMIIFMGNKKAREELEEDFERNRPCLYDKPVNLEKQGTYLGDELGPSVAESISLTIKKRIGLAKKAIFDIKLIIEDCRSQIVGGIKTGLLLWESCVLPYLLNNSSTWINMKKSDIDKLI